MYQVDGLTDGELDQLAAAIQGRINLLSAALGELIKQPASVGREHVMQLNQTAIRELISARHRIYTAIDEPEPDPETTFESFFAEADTTAIWHEYLDR